jgi:hypothetical protein
MELVAIFFVGAFTVFFCTLQNKQTTNKTKKQKKKKTQYMNDMLLWMNCGCRFCRKAIILLYIPLYSAFLLQEKRYQCLKFGQRELSVFVLIKLGDLVEKLKLKDKQKSAIIPH